MKSYENHKEARLKRLTDVIRWHLLIITQSLK